MTNSLNSCTILASLSLLMCLTQPVFGLTLFNRTGDNLKVHVTSYDKNNHIKHDDFSMDVGAQKDINIENCLTGTVGGLCLVIAETASGSPHRRGGLQLDNASKDARYFITPSTAGRYRISPV